MTGQAYINGKDIWLTWGAKLWKGTYEKLLKPPPMKEYISNTSRLEHGTRVVVNTGNARTEERDLSIQFLLEGDDKNDYLKKCASFIEELEKGLVEFKVPHLGVVYRLVYTDCSSYGDYGSKMGKFTVKFREPNTKNRTSTE